MKYNIHCQSNPYCNFSLIVNDCVQCLLPLRSDAGKVEIFLEENLLESLSEVSGHATVDGKIEREEETNDCIDN